ncbi:hypothetical protein HAX54_034617 [Datura stramonium]|uniref:Uncharacterized protein n=1 Tax=Datura stramonium TaxID=4076 RepID=A0ABS8VGW8_DATST|nr:hypothetical protein [Datura stramonium]
MRNSNSHYAEVVQKQELEISSLKEQMFHQGSRDLSSSKLLESDDSPLQAKLRKMHDSLEKAKMLNRRYQSDCEFQVSNEEVMDEISRQTEAETAQVIVCLQEELLLLQQEVRNSSLKEMETEVKTLEAKLSFMTEENRKLGENVYDKEKELINMSEEWEQSLENALNRRNDMESMLRSLRGAALVMTEAHQLDCREKDAELFSLTSQPSSKAHVISELENKINHREDQLRKPSVSATVAFLVVNWLSEQNSNYIDALNLKDMQLMESLETSRQKDAILCVQASIVAAAENQNESLRMELHVLENTCSDLRLQLFEEQRQRLEAIEEIDMLKTIEKLTEPQAGVSTVRSHLSECVERSGSHGKDISNETRSSFSSDDKFETWTGSETRQHSHHLESCILEDSTAEKQDRSFDKSNNMIGSASKQETFQMNWKDKDRDATIILLREEMESTLECLKGVHAKMAKLRV